MNFSRHQEQAERAGRRLLWLHGLATSAVVLAVNAAAALLWQLLAGDADPPRGFHLTNTGVVLGLIVGGAWLETARLREDGARIARRLGAVPVDTVADPLHRRLQNLLEELAIAARIGVPRAFVLEDEPTINALTAGLDRNQAVVVVTRGALSRLTRDELQGVLAHEVSHIVNGDVRLNTRLVAMNHGLELVALFGRAMLSRVAVQAREGRVAVLAAVPLLLAGVTLAVVGSVGELAARAIKAGVGRQREYFADAQAVAFTRSRDGLGGALRKIAGLAQRLDAEAPEGSRSRDPRREAALRHPYWQNVSHLLLAGPTRSRRWFATHPSLRDRVHRIYGRHLGALDPAPLVEAQRREPELPALEFVQSTAHADVQDGDRPWTPVMVNDGARSARAARSGGAAVARSAAAGRVPGADVALDGGGRHAVDHAVDGGAGGVATGSTPDGPTGSTTDGATGSTPDGATGSTTDGTTTDATHDDTNGRAQDDASGATPAVRPLAASEPGRTHAAVDAPRAAGPGPDGDLPAARAGARAPGSTSGDASTGALPPGLDPDGVHDDGVPRTAPMQLVQATRDPASAAALVVALLQEPGSPAPRWDEGWAAAAGRPRVLRPPGVAQPEASLRSLRWPLIELAVARLRPLSLPSREALLATVRACVAADGRVTLREWIYCSLLRLRLAPRRVGQRLPVLADPIDARSIRVLFALVAHAAQVSEARADRAANAAIRALDLAPIGGSAGALTLDALERAVTRAAQLPPLARPLLVRQLVAMLPSDADASVRDFLRVLCIAIDCPPPVLPPRIHTLTGREPEAFASAADDTC